MLTTRMGPQPTRVLRQVSLAAIALSVALLGCKKDGPVTPGQAAKGDQAGATAPEGKVDKIIGAGSTFVFPIMSRWGHAFHEATKTQVNYQSIGSGGGIKQIKAKTVDFGATDAPLEPKELEEAGLVQFPIIMGAVVPAVHLEGVQAEQLVLDGETLARMYLGDIKKWNDPAITALNPGVTLPDKAVTPVYRADGSGTTWIFTTYLATVSPAWKERVGAEKSVSWPTGVGGKGNEGVAAYVQRVDGAVGYVEYAYALQNKLAAVKMKNAAGQTVAPGLEAFQAAASGANWKDAPRFKVVLVNQPGEQSWPIVGATFILLHEQQQSAAKARTMLDFLDFGYRQGDESARELHYVPMPPDVVALVEDMWASQITADGKPVWQQPKTAGAAK